MYRNTWMIDGNNCSNFRRVVRTISHCEWLVSIINEHSTQQLAIIIIHCCASLIFMMQRWNAGRSDVSYLYLRGRHLDFLRLRKHSSTFPHVPVIATSMSSTSTKSAMEVLSLVSLRRIHTTYSTCAYTTRQLPTTYPAHPANYPDWHADAVPLLSLIHIWRCRRRG